MQRLKRDCDMVVLVLDAEEHWNRDNQSSGTDSFIDAHKQCDNSAVMESLTPNNTPTIRCDSFTPNQIVDGWHSLTT